MLAYLELMPSEVNTNQLIIIYLGNIEILFIDNNIHYNTVNIRHNIKSNLQTRYGNHGTWSLLYIHYLQSFNHK